jgi:hypothetical protein
MRLKEEDHSPVRPGSFNLGAASGDGGEAIGATPGRGGQDVGITMNFVETLLRCDVSFIPSGHSRMGGQRPEPGSMEWGSDAQYY